jgi:hypothetical protein
LDVGRRQTLNWLPQTCSSPKPEKWPTPAATTNPFEISLISIPARGISAVLPWVGMYLLNTQKIIKENGEMFISPLTDNGLKVGWSPVERNGA